MRALGVDLGATFLRAASSANGRTFQPLGRWRTPDDPADLESLLAEVARAAGSSIDLLGLAVACAVMQEGRVSAWPNRPAYVGLDLATAARRPFGVAPTFLDDCAAAALAEHLAGAGGREGTGLTTLFIGIGSGVGAGAVIADRLHLGATRSAFGVGHIRVPAAGNTKCPCGREGCLQTVASGRLLTAAGTAAGLPPDRVAELACEGDATALRLVLSLVPALSEGISAAALLLDPHRIVIGGSIARAGEPFLMELSSRLRSMGVCSSLSLASHGELAGCVGAVAWANLAADRAVNNIGFLRGGRDHEP